MIKLTHRVTLNFWYRSKFEVHFFFSAKVQMFCGVNPKYLATAEHGGIFCEISPFRNRHYLLKPKYLNF
jgi:hypothetical protein